MSEAGSYQRYELDAEQVRERTRAQIGIIEAALGAENVGVASGDSDDPADFLYLYRRQHVLVRDVDVDRVREALDGRVAVSEGLVNGLTRLALADDAHVPDVLDRLDRAVGVGVATPDHILYLTRTGGSCCPATEPEEPGTSDPVPVVNSGEDDGSGVLVSVVDTGWHPPAADDEATPWLRGVTGDPEIVVLAQLHPYAGHGTFIAGIVRCMAPRAEVRVEGFLPTGGAAFESDMVVQLCEALALGPDVISLSAGTKTRADRPTLSFEVFWENFLSQVKGTVMVAAAGNDATRAPFWPAAFPWAISVGALDANGQRASFSNFGSWVDVYALGEGLVNGYPRGTYICQEPPSAGDARHFEESGLARWSGTSFSTPIVAGRIAARMSATGLSARHSAEQLLQEARDQAVRGVGPRLT